MRIDQGASLRLNLGKNTTLHKSAAAAKGTWRAPAYDKSNSGVILWRKSRATMKLYHSWIHAYCSELCGNQIYGAFILNRRVVLHAIDATPAR